jgi:hypothetical protein
VALVLEGVTEIEAIFEIEDAPAVIAFEAESLIAASEFGS